MTQTKKLVYGGRRGYDNAVERHKAKGWNVVNETQIPTIRNRTIYTATLERD